MIFVLRYFPFHMVSLLCFILFNFHLTFLLLHWLHSDNYFITDETCFLESARLRTEIQENTKQHIKTKKKKFDSKHELCRKGYGKFGLSEAKEKRIRLEDCYTWQCTDCPIVAESLQELKQHHTDVHNQSVKFQCIECAKVYSVYKKFTRHARLHRNCGKYKYVSYFLSSRNTYKVPPFPPNSPLPFCWPPGGTFLKLPCGTIFTSCSHTFTLFWSRKICVIVKILQLNFHVFVCAFHPEISSFSGKFPLSLPIFCDS